MSPSYSGNRSIVLGDSNSLAQPGRNGNCSIAFTLSTFGYVGLPTGAFLTSCDLTGISGGAQDIEVGIQHESLPYPLLTVSPTSSDGTGTFTASFDLRPYSVAVGSLFFVTAKVINPANCTASISKTITFAIPGHYNFPKGTLASFHPGKSDFVAGNPDRIIESKIYSSLAVSFGILLNADKDKMLKMALRLGSSLDTAKLFLDDFLQQAQNGIDSLLKKNKKSASDFYNVLATAEQKAKKNFPLGLLLGDKNKKEVVRGKKWDALVKQNPKIVRPDPNFRFSAHQIINGLTILSGNQGLSSDPNDPGRLHQFLENGAIGLLPNLSNNPTAVTAGLYNYLNLGWLGVMHYDRLRFRSAGLCVGEHVYSVALSPGEETTLTQRSETKRSQLFEEVQDRSAEEELEFNSTWSTDISQGITDTRSETNTLGGGLQVSGSYMGFGGSVGGQASTSDTDTYTRSIQKSKSRSATERAASKLKNQHKTTFKISTDVTEEFGSRRLIRNSNPLRSATFHFYKVYEKYSISLERYDSRLCLGVFIEDPCRQLREEIQEELIKLDPVVQGSAYLNTSAGEISTEVLIHNGQHVQGNEYGQATLTFDIPAGMVLSDFQFILKEWIICDYTFDLFTSFEPYETTRDVARFEADGGGWTYPLGDPPINKGGRIDLMIRVKMPEKSGFGWWSKRIRATAVCKYTRPEAVVVDVQAEMESIKKTFSEERVKAIIAEVEGGARSIIFNQFYKQLISPSFSNLGLNPPIDLMDRFKNSFQWEDAQIDFFPWWMTETGSANRETLRKRLLALPGDVDSSKILNSNLISSYAKVYVPIHINQERSLLELLTGAAPGGLSASLESCVSEFENVWKSNYPARNRTLSTSNEIMQPSPVGGTSANSTLWQNEWEKHDRDFVVIDQWAEFVPTDGVHIESRLSDSTSADEARVEALGKDLEVINAQKELRQSQANAANSLVNKPNISTVVNIGDNIS